MKTAGVAALKARLTAYLRTVKHGNEVLITERGRPIAKLVPLPPRESEDERLDRLEAAGLITRGKGRFPDWFFELPKAKDPTGSVLKALLEEREDGR